MCTLYASIFKKVVLFTHFLKYFLKPFTGLIFRREIFFRVIYLDLS